MNCMYCQRPCRKIPNTDVGMAGGFILNGTLEYQCDYHGSVRVRHRPVSASNQEVGINILLCTVKDDTYASYFYYQPDVPEKFVVYKLQKKKYQVPVKVLTLDFHPDILPENIEKKLPLYFTFS